MADLKAEKVETWTMRYRTGVAGVRTGLVMATASKAEMVGKWWCGKEPGRKFVGMERAVLATEEGMLEEQTAPAVKAG